MTIDLRWRVDPATTTAAPVLQYRQRPAWPAPAGEWHDVPRVAVPPPHEGAAEPVGVLTDIRAQSDTLLDQITKAREDRAFWPQWMRDAYDGWAPGPIARPPVVSIASAQSHIRRLMGEMKP